MATVVSTNEHVFRFGVHFFFNAITEYRNQHRTNVYAHLPIVFDCRDVIIKCGQRVAHIKDNALGRWLNANLNGQFVIAI